MSASKKPTGPMSGVRIIEWGNNYTVPLAAMGLADQGADVIKVESPAGDGTRHTTAHRKGVKGLAASFVTANRNKRSIILDMKQPGAVDAFKALVKNADVVMQNFRPGVVDAYDLGYEGLKKIKPDIIFVSVSGYGTQGPYAKQRAWDPVVQATAGMMSSQSDPETNEPGQIRTSIVDKVTSLTVFQAVTAALYAHAKTGKGQHIEIDMLSAALAFSWTDAMFNHVWQGEGVQLGFDVRNLRLIYPTKDGRHICTIAISDPEWVALATGPHRPACRRAFQNKFRSFETVQGNVRGPTRHLPDKNRRRMARHPARRRHCVRAGEPGGYAAPRSSDSSLGLGARIRTPASGALSANRTAGEFRRHAVADSPPRADAGRTLGRNSARSGDGCGANRRTSEIRRGRIDRSAACHIETSADCSHTGCSHREQSAGASSLLPRKETELPHQRRRPMPSARARKTGEAHGT